jgi:hypothetical protein
MKRIAAVLAVVLAVAFTAGVALAAAPDKPVAIKGVQKSKPPVSFDHKKHSAVDCQKCHHADKKGGEQSCFKCHGEKADGKKLEAKEAFHKTCKGCHAEGKKGPTKCDECHKK